MTAEPPHRALIALGSNQGDRAATLQAALTALDTDEQVHVAARSQFYGTAAIGGPAGQEEFLNAAAALQTSLSPIELLSVLQEVEASLGRTREVRWAARTVDLDLLLYDEDVFDTPRLSLPHPRLAFRRFVLQPAVEIAPDWLHPASGWTLHQLLERLDQRPHYLAIAGTPAEVAAPLLERLESAANIIAVRAPSPLGESPASLVEFGRRQATQTGRALVSDFWLRADPQPTLVALLQTPTVQNPLRRTGGLAEAGFPQPPILWLDARHQELALDELAAAIQAMQ